MRVIRGGLDTSEKTWFHIHGCKRIPRTRLVFEVMPSQVKEVGLPAGWYYGHLPTRTVKKVTACPHCREALR